jgi:hypothetical protein
LHDLHACNFVTKSVWKRRYKNNLPLDAVANQIVDLNFPGTRNTENFPEYSMASNDCNGVASRGRGEFVPTRNRAEAVNDHVHAHMRVNANVFLGANQMSFDPSHPHLWIADMVQWKQKSGGL